MKKISLNAVAAAAALFASTAAFATVDIDAATGQVVVANEIIATAAAPVTLTNLGGSLDISTKIGYSLSSGEVRYVRAELANGVFTTASASVTSAGGVVGVINGVGTAVIYFSITAATAGITATDTITINGTRSITGTVSPMTVSYSVYDQPSQAQAGGANGRIVDKSGKAYVSFAKSHILAVTADSAIADVEATTPFALFKNTQTTGSTTLARLAALDFKLATAGSVLANGLAVALSDLMATGATGTKLVVTGDFSAAANADGTYTVAALNRVYLSTGITCGAVTKAADVVTATTATFNVGATATTANSNLCFAPRSGVAIPAATYSATLNAVSATPTTYAVANTGPTDISAITRNGTELQVPLFQNTAGYLSRFVLTNTGSSDANFSVSLKGEAGNTITAGVTTGVIPANGQLVLDANTVATAFTNASLKRGAAVFSVARPNNTIQGVYQITNMSTGAATNTLMVRPGTN